MSDENFDGARHEEVCRRLQNIDYKISFIGELAIATVALASIWTVDGIAKELGKPLEIGWSVLSGLVLLGLWAYIRAQFYKYPQEPEAK
jgi:hypothetical protein